MKKQDININIRVEPINQFAVWVHYMDHPLYERVRFRRRLDQAGSFWHYVSGNQNPLLVSELQPERGYQYQMMAYCAFEYSNWTPIRTFTTPPAPPPLFECGAIDTTPPLVNTGVALGRPLRPGDIVRLPQNSELTIRESTGTGPFRGYGTVFFNFFNTNLIMTFEALEVDDKMQWITGDLISRQSRGGGFIIDTDRPQDQNDQPAPPPTDTATAETPIIIADNTEIIITDSEGNPITEDSQPPFTITITNPDGEDQQITVENLPAVITDGSGAEFVVNQDGTVERKGTIEEERPGALAEVYHQFYIQINDNTTKHRSNYFAYLLASDRENILRISTSIPNIQFDVEDAFWTVNGVEQEIEELKIASTKAKTLYVSVLFSYTIRIDAGSEPAFRSGRIDSLRITFFEGGLVLFAKADPDVGDFGFDDAQLRQLRAGTTYRTEQIGGITYFVPWMSILPDAIRPADIRLRPQEMNFGLPQEAISKIEIELVSVDPFGEPSDFIEINEQNSIRLPASQIDRNIRITVAGYDRGYVVAYAVQGDVRQRVGKLEVEAKEPIDRTFRVVYVKKSTESSFPALKKDDIKHFLNTYSFNQVFFRWNPDDTPYSNQLVLNSVTARDSAELLYDIRRAYENMTGNDLDDESSPYYVFIVSNAVRENVTRVNGLALLGGRISLVFNQSRITTAHELGHNLGLRHIFVDYPTISSRTTRNLMDWPRIHGHDVRAFFHKFQRNILHP